MKRSMSTILLIILLASFSFASNAQGDDGSPKRLALIIANEDYRLPELQLDNPVNDALAISESLATLGFDNKLILNSSKQSLEQQLGVFISETREMISGGQEVVLLLYYAGHGIQFQGTNYLVPIDSELSAQVNVSAKDIKQEFSSLSRIANRLATLNAVTNIVILDACRDLPFYELSGTPIIGWTDLVKPNFFVAFGTAPGAKALDGTGAINGLYTQAIIEHIHTPGQNLSQLFQKVRLQVMQASAGYQIPQETNQATYDFYFANKRSNSSSVLFLLLSAFSAIALVLLFKAFYLKVTRVQAQSSVSCTLYNDKTSEAVAKLQNKPMLLGRGHSCDIKLEDSTNKLSREHCRLTLDVEKACVYIEERDSTNGTFVGGSRKPIKPHRKVKLTSGDRFFLAGPSGETALFALRIELAEHSGGQL